MYGESAAGGHAFMAIVDIALEIQRDRQVARRRIVKGLGRIIEIPDVVYELQDDGSMKCLGDPKELELEEVKVRLLEPDILDEEFRKTDEVLGKVSDPKPSKDQVTKALTDLSKAKLVERDPPIEEGPRQGVTYRWRCNFTSDIGIVQSEVKLEAGV